MNRTMLLMVATVGLGCGHTHHTGDAPKTASEENATPPKDTPSKKEPSKQASSTAIGPQHHKESASPNDPPLATSPEGLMGPGAIEKIQDRLRARDLLTEREASGRWDEATRKALRTFQGDAGLPATGMPDDVTVKKLGLAPKDIFRSADSRSP